MEQHSDGRPAEDVGIIRRKSKISDMPVVVFNTSFILLIQLVVIWVFCS
ncbi:MAG: hypothetical protein MJE63_08610 [Proteobacteria bacterium]|nr:hypothetical protein [Pseudomonadota bacterium]